MYLDVNDEYLGNVATWGRLNFTLPRISVRELVHERVKLELERLAKIGNAEPATVSLTDTEKRLNCANPASPISEVILQDQAEQGASPTGRQNLIAEKAFEEGRYFILLDDRQADDLDEIVDLERTGEVTFLLLTPLKGG